MHKESEKKDIMKCRLEQNIVFVQGGRINVETLIL